MLLYSTSETSMPSSDYMHTYLASLTTPLAPAWAQPGSMREASIKPAAATLYTN